MKTVTDEEYDALVQAANAWKDFTKRRILDGPYVPEEVQIQLINITGNVAKIKIIEGIIQTPYGHIRRIDGEEYHLQAGDSIRFKREVVLTINS